MSVVISSNYVIGSVATDGGVINDDNPIIGWDNILVGGQGILTTTTADPDFPTSNMLTNSTNLKWEGDATEVEEYILITNPGAMDIDYVAIARHNLGSELMPVSVEGYVAPDVFTKLLLHFNGVDASTTITDSSPTPKAMTAGGNAQIDTDQSKFGNSSALFDGTGDLITTPDNAAYTLGTQDFTFECWFNCTAAGGASKAIGGQATDGFAAGWMIRRETSNVMSVYIRDSPAVAAAFLTGTTQFTNVLNTGFHHLALTRSGNTFGLWIDGVLEASATASFSIADNAALLCIGAWGSTGGADQWAGWMDEVRFSVGIARYTTNFTPPTTELDWSPLTNAGILPNDGPALFRFPKLAYSALRLKIEVDLVEPIIAVIYCGELLVLQRRLYVGHAPINYSVDTRAVNGRSESGDFLGRIVLTEMTSTQLQLVNLTPGWVRDYLVPFLTFARAEPFFMAWRPGDYPQEVGYCWMTNDPKPVNQRSRGHMQLTLEMGGVT